MQVRQVRKHFRPSQDDLPHPSTQTNGQSQHHPLFPVQTGWDKGGCLKFSCFKIKPYRIDFLLNPIKYILFYGNQLI